MHAEKLRIIFENLRMVRKAELFRNHLEEMDTESLKIIFENLKNVQRIEITESEAFVNKLVSLFPHLERKIINIK